MGKKSTSDEGRDSALSISGWSLRRKVALALAIPLLLAATLGGLRVAGDLTESTNSSASARQVTVLRPAVDYLTAAQAAMVAAQSSTGSSKTELGEALGEIKAAAQELADTANRADLTFEQRYQVDAMLDLSAAIRAETAASLSPGTWVAQLRQLQSGTTQLVARIINAQRTPEPRLELLSQTLSGRFSLAMQQALASTERIGRTGSLELFAELGAESAAIDRLASALGNTEPVVLDLRTANGERTREVRTGGSDLGDSDAYEEYDELVTSLMDGVDQHLAASAGDARQRAVLNAAITLGALLAAIALALLISRLLINPIRRVRESALQVAHHELPEAVARIRAGAEPEPITPIDVTTQEEVGQLARAVDDLHRQAVTLASGEATLRSQVGEMFVTLSRRNTSLINQQLHLIETLEKDEEDPKRLESLFRLDHLASRIRRTADSLLILADAPTRSAGWESITVGEALQAATAGVQDYQRVRIQSGLVTRISEGTTGDVIHLLTELVDNALSYSAPSTVVRLSTRTLRDGVVISVSDAGLGIPAAALAQINDNLDSGAEVTPETARRMGLFVVSRLAQRHGISVSLVGNGDKGITADVFLPNAVLRDLQPPDKAPVEDALGVLPPEPAYAPPAPVAVAPVTLTALDGPAPEGDRPSLPSRRAQANPSPAAITSLLGGASPSTQPAPGAPEVPAAREESPGDGAGERSALPSRRAQTNPSPTSLSSLVTRRSVPPAEPAPSSYGEERPARRDPLDPDSTEWRDDAEGEPAAAEAEPAPAEPAPERTAAVYHLSTLPGAVDQPVAEELAPAAGDGVETPIFGSLRSSWLSSDEGEPRWEASEVEAGWHRADEVAQAAPEAPQSDAGLPVRNPGTMLIPGGVTKTPTARVRDPEAIRARLSAHSAGVRRGRSATTAQDQERK